MARFGRDIVKQLTDPTMAQGMFELGRQIGGLPGERRKKQKEEKEREEALARFDEISRISGQAQSSAIAGTPAALAENIRLLEEASNKAPTLKEKQAIQSRIIQLRGMTYSAQQKKLKNDISAVSKIDNALEGIDERQDIPEDKKSELKKTLALRKSQLLENPEIEQGYRQDQLNKFQFEESERVLREENYIREKQLDFQTAIRSGDQDQLDAVLKSVPPEFQTVANQYVTGAVRNNQVLEAFKEKSIALKTKPMTVTELDSLIDELPEGSREAMAVEIKEYKEAIKGWSEETQWSGSTQARNRAKQAESAITSRISGISNSILMADISERRRVEAQDKAAIAKLELQIDARPSDTKITNRAKIITKNKDGNPTLEDYQAAEAQLRAEQRDDALSAISKIDPKKAEELGYGEESAGAISLNDAKALLSDDPSEKNKAYFLQVYGPDAFAEWQKESKGDSGRGVLDTAFGVPARAVAGAISENVFGPAMEALDLAATRKKVGKTFRDFGGDLSNISTEELLLISQNPKGFESRINKINSELVKRMSGD